MSDSLIQECFVFRNPLLFEPKGYSRKLPRRILPKSSIGDPRCGRTAKALSPTQVLQIGEPYGFKGASCQGNQQESRWVPFWGKAKKQHARILQLGLEEPVPIHKHPMRKVGGPELIRFKGVRFEVWVVWFRILRCINSLVPLRGC